MGGPVESAWQEQRAAAARLMELWADLAGAVAGTDAAKGAGTQLQTFTRGIADYAAVALRPLRDLVDNQREFADQMTRWAELQRELADNMAAWAAQQRQYADALDALMDPLSASSQATTSSPTDRDDR